MRGRRRTRSARRQWSEVCVNARRDTDSTIDPELDRGLRALARLLARQAARKMFEREQGSARVDQHVSEDPQ